MKSLLLPCLTMFMLVMNQFSLHSQSYHPLPTSGAQWNVTRCWFFYPGGWHDEYSIMMDGTDTTINNHVYKKLYLQSHHAPGTEFDSTYTHFLGAVREADKKWFFISEYQCIDTIERMVYDFGPTKAGDSIFTQVLTNGLTQTIKHYVTSVDSTWVGSEYHRRINLTDESGYVYESWTEGVGSSLGLTYASYWILTDNSYDLNCFYNHDNLEYVNPNPFYLYCTSPLPEINCSLTTSIPEIHKPSFTLYPNPAFNEITIIAKEAFRSINILNELGELVQKVGHSNTADISSLPPGLFFVQVIGTSGDVVLVEKLIKR